MQLHAFQADKGDCLLLESKDGKNRMLIDGGIGRAYKEHVAPALGKLRSQKKALDIVYISHIDDDHIAGVLQLLNDETLWRVHDHQTANGNTTHPKPLVPRPAVVKSVFHNAFHDLLKDNTGEIEAMLAARAGILSGADDALVRAVGEYQQELATSIPQGLRVSNRISKQQLNIPLNQPAGGKLLMVRSNTPGISLGSITLNILGPFPEDLTKLRKDWNTWLRENKEQLSRIRTEARTAERDLGTNVGSLIDPLIREAEKLGADVIRVMELANMKTLGDRRKVTTPNLASLMFLAEEDGQTILLTGDGHWEDILKGLEHHQRFDPQGNLHVDVLKVQHHGSEHNIKKEFCDRVTANHYVFNGNGEHENPDLDVIELIFDRRMANDEKNFTFSFTSTSAVSFNADGQEHMQAVEDLVRKLKQKSPRLRTKFIRGSSMRVI
jgi:hypothetical protein